MDEWRRSRGPNQFEDCDYIDVDVPATVVFDVPLVASDTSSTDSEISSDIIPSARPEHGVNDGSANVETSDVRKKTVVNDFADDMDEVILPLPRPASGDNKPFNSKVVSGVLKKACGDDFYNRNETTLLRLKEYMDKMPNIPGIQKTGEDVLAGAIGVIQLAKKAGYVPNPNKNLKDALRERRVPEDILALVDDLKW